MNKTKSNDAIDLIEFKIIRDYKLLKAISIIPCRERKKVVRLFEIVCGRCYRKLIVVGVAIVYYRHDVDYFRHSSNLLYNGNLLLLSLIHFLSSHPIFLPIPVTPSDSPRSRISRMRFFVSILVLQSLFCFKALEHIICINIHYTRHILYNFFVRHMACSDPAEVHRQKN